MARASGPAAPQQERVLKLRLELTMDDRVTLFDDQIIARLLQVLGEADTRGDLFPGIVHPGPGERLRNIDLEVTGVARRRTLGLAFGDTGEDIEQQDDTSYGDSTLDELMLALWDMVGQLDATSLTMRGLMNRIFALCSAEPPTRPSAAVRKRLLAQAHALLTEAIALLPADPGDDEDGPDPGGEAPS
jgi:hypothetical protein